MSQQSYKVSSIGPHFSEEELRYEVIFPEWNLEGQGWNSRLCTWIRSQERKAALGPKRWAGYWGWRWGIMREGGRCWRFYSGLGFDARPLRGLSKCGFTTGVADGPADPGEGPRAFPTLLLTAAGQVASFHWTPVTLSMELQRVWARTLLRPFPAIALCDAKKLRR